MASSQHVEVEAAKFLHKLIQESKDEPAKLATKLYVVCFTHIHPINTHTHKEKEVYICQHMKMSGKEQSLPYQVISSSDDILNATSDGPIWQDIYPLPGNVNVQLCVRQCVRRARVWANETAPGFEDGNKWTSNGCERTTNGGQMGRRRPQGPTLIAWPSQDTPRGGVCAQKPPPAG
ncbi:hypothetical protein Taro_042390, partial [Colocasia esculenta]|nr:hypothetical protein [Colocasia esculenta]